MKAFILFLSSFAFVCIVLAQQEAPKKILLKVNLAGGPAGDFLGEEQVLETDGLHKTSTKDVIQNTDQQEIFQTQRFARDEDFVMRIPVPDGIYALTLLFAETYKKACIPGGRVFDISLGTPISGVTTIIEDFDVFQAAGCTAAYGKRFDKVPSKGGIVVHLRKKKQHPSLSGFVVEGFPVPKGDGSEYRAVGQAKPEGALDGANELSGMDGAAPRPDARQVAPGGLPLVENQSVGGPLGQAIPAGPLPNGASESPLDGQPPLGPSLAGTPPMGQLAAGQPPAGPPAIGISGDAGENELVTGGAPQVGPGTVMAEGQKIAQMAQQPQMSGPSMEIGQSQITGHAEGMGPQLGQVSQMPGNMETSQPAGIADALGSQQPGSGIRM